MASYGSSGRSAYRKESGVWLVEIRLQELRQLFSHLDPAPFREKDLDPEAENYIEGAAREIGLGRPTKLLIHLPAGIADSSDARTAPEAVRNYFSYRARQTRNELHRLLARGFASLAIGLAFLSACLTLRRSLVSAGSDSVVAEGLLIIGWVALWRPVEIFLYDWWPIRRRQRILEAIARMPVEVVASPGPASRVGQ